MLTYEAIAKNIEKAGTVKKGLRETAKKTGLSYWQVRDIYYSSLQQKTRLCRQAPAHPKIVKKQSFWDRADRMKALFEEGNCPETIARMFDIKADTVLLYIKLAASFPPGFRMSYRICRQVLSKSPNPLRSIEILKEIEKHGGKKALRKALLNCKPESLEKFLQTLQPAKQEYTFEQIRELQQERDFYFRRMKALERINQQYVKTLQKMVDKEKSQKEFQKEYGLKALEDPVFNEFSPSLVELRKKCRTLDDVSDYYKFLMFLERLLTRNKIA